MIRELLDTSVLIADRYRTDGEWAVSAASLAELHFGLLSTESFEERSRRAHRLGAIEASIEPLPIDANVAREWGRLAAAVSVRGGKPRRRIMDLMIAATANAHGLVLVTHDERDFAIIEDLINLRPAG